MASRGPASVMFGTPKPHESLTRVTVTRTIARRLGCEGNCALSAGHASEAGTTTSPRPWKRMVFGAPWLAQHPGGDFRRDG